MASRDFEPNLGATTRNLGGSVEVRIRDNGTRIPAEVREKMFNPFFTTKPAGEGTGLGLSMTHDVIVSNTVAASMSRHSPDSSLNSRSFCRGQPEMIRQTHLTH
jgi:C4-dicarboxylate-specific signal transduction histidine kinase